MKYVRSYDNLILENTYLEWNPISKILSSKFTVDRKHIIVEGVAYSCETGEFAAINEEWSLSDILHAGADILSAGLDIVVPGTGAIVDILNAVSYIIEAQFAEENKKDSLYVMSAITFAFVIIPGPIQAISIPLKRFIKSGAKTMTPLIRKALGMVTSLMPKILKELPKRISAALKTPLGKTLLGRFAGKINGAVKAFASGVLRVFNKIMGRPDVIKQATKIGAKEAMSTGLVTALKKFITRAPKAIPPAASAKLLKKLGFVPNKLYRYINTGGKATTAKIIGSSADGASVLVKFGKGNVMPLPVATFVKNTIGAPWGRRGFTVAAPLFIKRFASVLNDDGDIDLNKLETIDEIDPSLTSSESLAFLQEEVADYEGDTQKYSVDQPVIDAQTALSKLGYTLAIDGMFGPETLGVLKQFQQANGLNSSLGKLDNLTLNKLKELSKNK
jgi:hypothetical protein